jgi:hypothetical protein
MTILPLLCLIACKRQVIVSEDVDRMRKVASVMEAADVFDAAVSAMGTNAASLNQFATAMHDAAMRSLDVQTTTEIRRKLDTLKRGTNRHPYTREQLEETLKRRKQTAEASDAVTVFNWDKLRGGTNDR